MPPFASLATATLLPSHLLFAAIVVAALGDDEAREEPQTKGPRDLVFHPFLRGRALIISGCPGGGHEGGGGGHLGASVGVHEAEDCARLICGGEEEGHALFLSGGALFFLAGGEAGGDKAGGGGQRRSQRWSCRGGHVVIL